MTRLHGADYLDALRLGRGMLTWDVTPGSGAAGLIGIARHYLTGFAAAALVATYQPWIAVGALATALVMRVRWRTAIFRIIGAWMESWRDRSTTQPGASRSRARALTSPTSWGARHEGPLV